MSTEDRSNPFDNEQKAELGEAAVRAVVETLGDVGPAIAQIEDVLLYIAHLLDRYGLEPAGTFRDALRRYRKDIEAGSSAQRIADGRTASIEGEW